MPASVGIPVAEVEEGLQRMAQHGGPAGIRSPTVMALHSAGWLLLVCLFLPVCRSCNGPVVRPVEILALRAPIDVADVLWRLVTVCVYGNGALMAMVVTVSACLQSRNFWWRAFVAQLAVTCGLGLAFFVVTLFSENTTEQLIEGALVFWLPIACSLAWIAAALRRGQLERAWARLQHVWNIGTWIELHLLCLFRTELLFGYWVTLLAIVAQFFAIELARHRLHHDLWDRTCPPEPLRFSLRTIFLWTTIPPLIFTYYQSIDPLVEWLRGAS